MKRGGEEGGSWPADRERKREETESPSVWVIKNNEGKETQAAVSAAEFRMQDVEKTQTATCCC